MKQIFGIVLAAVLLVGTAAFAVDGCCGAAAGGAKVEGKCTGGGGGVLSKLNLTDEQKTKVSALHGEMAKAANPAEAREKFMKGLKEILTPEQYSQFQVDCQKMQQSGGCPAMKDAGKAEPKS